jgi:hypothetical protein
VNLLVARRASRWHNAVNRQSSGALWQMLDNVRYPLPRLILQLIIIVLATRARRTYRTFPR